MLGERDELAVDGAAMTYRLAGGPDRQLSVDDRHQLGAATHVDGPRLKAVSVLRGPRGQGSSRLQNLNDLIDRESVLLTHGDHVGRAEVGREIAEKGEQRRQRCGADPYPDDRQGRGRRLRGPGFWLLSLPVLVRHKTSLGRC